MRTLVATAIALSLSACSGGSDDLASGAVNPLADSSLTFSLSAEELNEDPRSTISFAQAVAAGVIDLATIEAADTATPNENTTVAAAPATDESATIVDNEGANAPSLGAATPETSTSNGTGNGAQDIANASAPIELPESTDDIDTANSSVVPVDLSAQQSDENTIGQRFASHTSDGFEGVVQDDGSIRISWNEDLMARGYNIYRDGEYVTSVFSPEWIDNETVDDNYYYEIERFDFADTLTRIATGLTVKVRGSGRAGPDLDAPGVDLQEYELVFSDEFNGDSLDFSKWRTSYLWGTDIIINSEEQFYVDTLNDPDFGYDPFSFNGETLTISAIRTPDALREKALGQPYLSGVINSRDAFNFTYGYAEARAKVPFGRGLWSAFWLLNSVYDGGDEPEIDIMEHIGDNQDVAYHTYHYYDNSGPTPILHSTESMPVVGIDFTADFHTFAVDWQPGRLIFYVDGMETHRINDSRVSGVDMYVLANLALGGWWPGSPDATTEFPAQYELDYIRVYQRITPFDDQQLFNDAPSNVQTAQSVPGTSPSRRPPIDIWPEGYPTRTGAGF